MGAEYGDETGWNRVEVSEVRWDSRLEEPAGLAHDWPRHLIKA